MTGPWIQISNTSPANLVLETHSAMCMKYLCTVHQEIEFYFAYVLKQFGPYLLKQSTLVRSHHLVFHMI